MRSYFPYETLKKKKALMYVSLFLSCKGSSRGSTILINSFETVQLLQEEANQSDAKFYTFLLCFVASYFDNIVKN